MPPKKFQKKVLPVDWEWAGTEIKKPEDITPQHRLRAAGLVGVTPCHFHPILRPSDDDIKPLGDSNCNEKRCKSWPTCYNHIGAEEVLEQHAKQKYLDRVLGDPPQGRDGPAGLRNVGATCFANAFLQLWFHNIAFRNGVYSCYAQESTPLYHLSSLFAQLELSERAVVDTTSLIEALRLEKGSQQDAAEFSKLFMGLIASEFQKQADDKVKSLVEDQFQGTLEYITQCETCRYQSSTSTAFLELELSLKNGTTLKDCLDRLVGQERLDGDNKYHCPRCITLQPAVRYARLLSVPPIIHFSLLRFVYDPKTEQRKRVPASISYPREIKLCDQDYELAGVVSHWGTSAHHGHFVSEVHSESDGHWYLFNDSEVTTVQHNTPQRPKKRLRPDPDSPEPAPPSGPSLNSKDAYMLVYARKEKVIPVSPPAALVESIMADNIVLHQEIGEWCRRQEVASDEFDHINGAKRDVLKVISGLDHIIPRDSLKEWLEGKVFDDLCIAPDFSSITCEHGGIDPSSTGKIRLISHAAFDRFQSYFSLPDMAICSVCVEEGFHYRLDKSQLNATRQLFDEMNQRPGSFLLPARWVDEWKRGKLRKGTLPTSDGYSLYCHHDAPWKGKSVMVTAEALAILRSSIGDFPAFTEDDPKCEECTACIEGDKGKRAQWAKDVKVDKGIAKYLDNSAISFDTDYFVLPKRFLENWERYLNHPIDPPTLGMDLCEHGKVDFDPMMEKMSRLSQVGWEKLCEKYGKQQPIIVQYGPNPLPGKMTQVVSVNPEVCDPCRCKRLSEFVEAAISITLVKDALQAVNPQASNGSSIIDKNRRSTRSNGKHITVIINKATTTKDVKVQIYEITKISPVSQSLYHNGRELHSEDTIDSLGVLAGDTLVCVELEEKDDFDEVGEEGFGGTALMAPMACPDCTFENESGAEMCAMCTRPFGFG